MSISIPDELFELASNFLQTLGNYENQMRYPQENSAEIGLCRAYRLLPK